MPEIDLITIILVSVVVIFFFFQKAYRKIIKDKSKLHKELKESEVLQSETKEELDAVLEKYGDIIDVQAEIDQRKRDFAKIEKEKEFELEHIQLQIDEILSSAKSESKEIKQKAKERLEDAQLQVKTILQNANKRGEEIAGEALDAKRNADHYEATIIAMKNIISGYGNEYLKPTFSVLDGLAEEYTHTEAGVELKRARERAKLMVKDNLAAVCDYVEHRRKVTAINFVIDAFNGKVDTILSRVKHDNFGKLEQQIKDSFYLVNNNGKAFRNASITTEYLNARLDELRWAVKVHYLLLEEREEQRQIKEAMREEERARREYERAIKDAEKEERILQKAMKEAQKKLEAAGFEERVKYEQQLEELRQKLSLAEEKNQRALSMAQQTRKGHVYVISNIGSFGENVFKIGLTRRLEPLDRVKELGDASVPFKFDVHAMISCEDAPALEKSLHVKFKSAQVNKVNARKEFFRVSLLDIKDEIEKLGINAKWTLKAEAQEYRETIALENKQLLEEEFVLN